MSCYVGIDIGAVSATAAVLLAGNEHTHLAESEVLRALNAESPAGRVYISPYRRTQGRPIAAATELLDEIISAVGAENVSGVCLTGSGSRLVAGKLGADVVNEFKALAAGVSGAGIDARTVFEMGGEASKYLRLEHHDDGSCGIVDYATNGDCAAGTGSFLDQQAGRLQFKVEDIGPASLSADRAAQIAGRCSVFAKSDMIHAQQKGYGPREVLRGLCDAVARNFRSAVVRSHTVEPPVALVGGVAANEAVVRSMLDAFELDESQIFVPEGFAHLPAIGAAVNASRVADAADLSQMSKLRSASDTAGEKFPTTAPLGMDNVILLRDRVQDFEDVFDGELIDAYLGLDVGSVSTNLVVIDETGQVITEIYTRTQGRPIEVVSESLKQIRDEWGDRLNIRGVGTTGSGRELIGILVGADTINDEITAHKTGATFIGHKMLDGRVPDTIFEIGGQDSKYISLQDGVVVDFTMNDACAAGTGSFLEERAEELGISIKGEFADQALSSERPIRLGERCTVFMERDVNSYLQKGAETDDLVAGLAYSVVYNYINRVVRGRKIGESIYFQGGTAYNDAVAAAFAAVCGKEIIVPPHNGVMGAIGAALLARGKMNAELTPEEVAAGAGEGGNEGTYLAEADRVPQTRVSQFRGYDLSRVNYTLREFTCKACSNNCQIQEFTVEGEKTYWGDKCSSRYRQQAKSARRPVIDDLLSLRTELLHDASNLPEPPADAPTVGIPMCMFAYDQLPFWRTLLTHCGLKVELSETTNNKLIGLGGETAVAEPCFPIIVAHGHIRRLCEREDIDKVLVPNIVSVETQWTETESHLCPWHQTLPFVTRRAPGIEPHADTMLSPTVHFREGRKFATREFQEFFGKELNVPKRIVARAVERAYEAQANFRRKLLAAGREALEKLDRSGEMGIVLVGRPYNIHDAGVNLSVGFKLRKTYGVNVIPMDFLDTEPVDIRDINENMYWTLGERILSAAKIVGQRDNLHIIHITNFKCGPDSFVKHFIRRASNGKPFLSIQFDAHSNDAGIMTRCEAYLDSKGILRLWRSQQPAAATA
ncbi:MAG: acyl-CoA dehydratase activase [Planctomycetota bacterium]